MKRLAAIAAIAVLPLVTAQACGPEFFPDIFIHSFHPDRPKQFAEGQLGILLPTFPRADLIVAFRYLNGGTLTPQERAAYQPSYSIAEADTAPRQASGDEAQTPPPELEPPADRWVKARSRYVPTPVKIDPERTTETPQPGGWTRRETYDNCYADSFRTAIATLKARAKTWGDKSPTLLDWIHGQDAVFANCPGPANPPVAAPVGSPSLLQQDRAYQLAAALFYAGKLPEARAAFHAVAQDSVSPWHNLAPYLEARTLVRQAFFSKASGSDEGPASFDPALMQQAANLLQSLLKDQTPGLPRKAIQNELDLVRLRTDTQARVRELTLALTGPAPDPDYQQNLADLTWYLDQHLDSIPLREDADPQAMARDETGEAPKKPASPDAPFAHAYNKAAKLRPGTDLIDWLITFQSPSEGAKIHALAEWNKTHQLSWLIAAISKASGKDAATPELLKAAADIKPDNPASESISYHRIRLLLESGQTDQARALLDPALSAARASGRDSSLNAFTGLRMHAATTLDELLASAPRKLLVAASQSRSALDECQEVMKNPKRSYDCLRVTDKAQFSDDAAAFFNTQAPLSLLVQATQSHQLPDPLRRSLAIMAWTRSILLHDDAAAAALFPLLPAKVQQQAQSPTGFHAWLTLTRNPGLRPFLDPGIQRSDSYDFIESFRDNWWCGNMVASEYQERPHAPLPLTSAPPMLTPAMLTVAQHQYDQLNAAQHSKLLLGNQVFAYVNDHPSEPDAAEALYLILRMIRYGCDDFSYSETGEAKSYQASIDTLRTNTARLLRKRYLTSPWTKKAAPFA